MDRERHTELAVIVSRDAFGTDLRIIQRVYSEFLEMPGLRLTHEQAQRLWQLDATTCLGILDALVDAKFLCRTGSMYARLTDGPADSQRPRMARTFVDVSRQVEKVG